MAALRNGRRERRDLIEGDLQRGRRARPDRRLRHRGCKGRGRLVGLERRETRLRMAVLGRPHHDPLAPRFRAALRSARTRPARSHPRAARAGTRRRAPRIAAHIGPRAWRRHSRRSSRLFPAVARRHEGQARGTGRGLANCCPSASRAGGSRPISTPGRACRARCKPARCSRLSTRLSSSGRAPSACSISATASRSTRRPKSASTATTCCPSCSATRIVARVDLKADRPAGVLRVLAAYAEPGAPPETAAELMQELKLMQAWLGARRHAGRSCWRPGTGAGTPFGVVTSR